MPVEPIIVVSDSNYRAVYVLGWDIFVDKADDAPVDLERDFNVDFSVAFKPVVRIALQGVYD